MNNEIKQNGNDFEVVQATPDHMRVMDAMAEALEIAVGYTALVASGQGDMPIREDRAKDDTCIICKALAEYAKIKGE